MGSKAPGFITMFLMLQKIMPSEIRPEDRAQ
jgi:hypothetical protein